MVLYGEKEVTEFLKECEEVMLHDVQTARLSAILHKQNIEIKKNRAFFGHGLMVWERQSRP